MHNYIAAFIEKLRRRRRKKELNNSDFTILSSECAAGVIYHELGMRFLSPTINLWFKPTDFLAFLKNLNYYLNIAELEKDKNNNYDYPVGILGEDKRKINLYFQHYDTFENAKNKWNQRKRRVNFDNIFVIMTDRDGANKKILSQFDKLPFKNKVVLVGREYSDINSSLLIPNCYENGHLGDIFSKSHLTCKSKLDEFDFVNFLNGNGNKVI